MNVADHITHERLLQVLHYDPLTGIWTALINRRRTRAGSHPAVLNTQGYIQLGVDGRIYLSHRLAWFYVHGVWIDEVDHRDLDKTNNRLANLRDATRSQNSANKPAQSNNKSGLKGVSWFPGSVSNPWRAAIGYEKKQIHLGLFSTKEEAHAAYVAAAERLYGEFGRAA